MKTLIPFVLFLSLSIGTFAQSPAQSQAKSDLSQKCVALAFKRNLTAFLALVDNKGHVKLDKHELSEKYSDLIDQMDYAHHDYPVLQKQKETIQALASVTPKRKNQ